MPSIPLKYTTEMSIPNPRTPKKMDFTYLVDSNVCALLQPDLPFVLFVLFVVQSLSPFSSKAQARRRNGSPTQQHGNHTTHITLFGLDHRFGHLPPGVETPGYYPPSLQDGKSPIGATYNSPVIYCRVDGTMIKARYLLIYGR